MAVTDERAEYLRQHYPNESTAEIAAVLALSVRSVMYYANKLGLRKTREYFQKIGAKYAQHPRAVATRFTPGRAANKGVKIKYRTAETKKAADATRYKKGNKPHNWVPIGTEKNDKYGYVKIKIQDCCGFDNWQLKHVVVWEAAHGKIPAHHCLQFKDGNTTNCALDNLELISRADLCDKNTIHRYPPEVKQLIVNVAKAKKALNNKNKNKKQ